MATNHFALAEVLAVAKRHPFYSPDVQYPPDAKEIDAIRESVRSQAAEPDLRTQPLLHKSGIYNAVERLLHDMSPQNLFRKGSYLSTTGGGSGSYPMVFATDVRENRQQRLQLGNFIRLCGVVDSNDWVLSLHTSGSFYRSLDLMTETTENAGATVLSAGSKMDLEDVAGALAYYHVNVLAGDPSQIIQLVSYISTLAQDEQDRIILNKVIYTSEQLTRPQRAFIRATLGNVKICSVMGSAEAGPWAVSTPDLLGEQDDTSSSTDFVFDTRHLVIEILPTAHDDSDMPSSPDPLPLGEPGIIVQTSLQRLKNPLVRYITGDVGSLHALPPSASAHIPEAERQHLRVLRMQGRDRRFSFKWFGEYFEFLNLNAAMQEEQSGVLQWQVILDKLDSSPQPTLEVRMLRAPIQTGILSEEAVIARLRTFFYVFPESEHLFRVTFIREISDFELSTTGGKVIKFVDRFN